jgi:hypothetical protein
MAPEEHSEILSRVNDILTPDESVLYITVQTPMAGFKPDAVVLTNKRFIIYHPGLLGIKFDDFLWRDLIDIKLTEGLLGAN